MTIIKLPDRVPIASQVYTTKVAPFYGPDAGVCAGEPLVVHLNDEFANETQMLHRFAHEYIHAICNEYRIVMSDDDVDRMAQGFTQLVLALVMAQ